MSNPTFGSLFAGIGGLDLGLERAGWECRWQVEIDDYATKVLEKHWPHVERFRDVRTVGRHNLTPVSLIAGGFPCQDISNAGLQVGLSGSRSGLWDEFFRIVCELRPDYVFVENVSALLHRGIDRVLADLAGIGFDAEWSVVSACSLGAPHMRERLFIVAYPYGEHVETGLGNLHDRPQALQSFNNPPHQSPWLQAASKIYRMADGLPGDVDRRRGLGNAVVPQVAEYIGRLILEAAG